MNDPTQHPQDPLLVTTDGPQQPSPEQNPVDAAYGMEARTMLKAIALPESDPIPVELQQQVRKTVKAHITKRRITYRAVGRQIAVSDSVISEVLNGKYRGNASAIIRKLNAWVDDDERRRSSTEPLGFYETSIFTSIRDASVIAKRNARTSDTHSVNDETARIVVVYGPSGCGKSVGAKALHAHDPNSILIRVRQRAGGDSGIAKLIIESAGWRGKPTKTSTIEFVIEKLRHSGRLLVIDEAHRLAPSGYELLRDLADECGIPILLLGTDKIRRKVDTVRRGLGGFLDDQFNRRVFHVIDLLRGSDGKGGRTRPFFTLDEIREIFRRDKVTLTDDGAELLCAIACTVGSGMIGMAAVIHKKAEYAARRRNYVVDASLLWKATKGVMLAAGVVDDDHPMFRQIEASLEQVRTMSRTEVVAAAG